MDKIIEALLKILPFAQFFENCGMSEAFSLVLSGAITTILAVFLSALAKHLVTRYKTSKTARDLAPYFDYRAVKASSELFIPTQCQNHSPTREEEPKFSRKFIVKEPLIPFFINTAFNEKKESDKFYLILADSGMGKTTFMINLYMRYTSFFNLRKKYKIKLFPFGDSRILDKIKKIKPEDAHNTILLLDAFDEDKKLIPPDEPDGIADEERFRSRLDEIIEAVRDFREVVLTSRTQYFPGQEDKPYELKIPRFGHDGFHILAKLYLSPFDDKEIRKYLRKKYGVLRLWNRKKKKIAAAIVKNSPRLMVRPMLLSYIDFLVDINKVFNSTYEIYETLVAKWIEREAKKRKHKTSDREKFMQYLCDYSRLVALEIFKARKQSLSLPKNTAVEIARKNNIDLSDYEITGQSLLTRDAEGSWKFAHKSVFEFLIAREALKNPESWRKQNLDGMDMAGQFILEKCPNFYFPEGFLFVKGGTFLMGSPKNEAGRNSDETQHQVKVGDFYMAKYPVTVAEFEAFITDSNYKTDADKEGHSRIWDGSKWNDKKGVTWKCDVKGEIQPDKKHPVIHVSWNDALAYCEWLSKQWNITFRLPTEAEWEFACRAGTTTPFNTGDNLTTDQANYDGNHPYKKYPKGKYSGKTTPAGSYPPNAWGFYDMHGNVWEWCMDWYGKNYYEECKNQGIVDNPRGPDKGSSRVLRGGSWSYFAQYCRSASRCDWRPGSRYGFAGFRLVFVPQFSGSHPALPVS